MNLKNAKKGKKIKIFPCLNVAKACDKPGKHRVKTKRKGELNKCLFVLIWECLRLLLVISLLCIKYFIKEYKNMNNNYLTVWRIPGGYKIRAEMEINPNRYHSMKYYDYSKREAIRRYRQQFGLVGKHLQLIEI